MDNIISLSEIILLNTLSARLFTNSQALELHNGDKFKLICNMHDVPPVFVSTQ